VNSLILTSSVITIILTPIAFRFAPRLSRKLDRWPALARFLGSAPPEVGEEGSLTGHVIIAGYGRVGEQVIGGLRAAGMPIAVIETDLHRIQQLRAAGIPAVYGDASHASILSVVHIERARLVVVALPDAGTTRAVVREIRRVNPTLPILARAPRAELEEELRAAGATNTFAPERAGALLMLEEGLRLLDLPQADNDRLAVPDTLTPTGQPLSA